VVKKPKFLALSIVSILVLMAVLNCSIVGAQATATVIVSESTGGTTDITGTTTYADGDTVTITATPDADFVFSTWVVSPSDGSGDMVIADNPLTFTAAGDVTYTIIPVFIVPSAIPGRPLPSDLSTSAVVVVLSSAGGTTIPPPGTYALANAEAFNLAAMPSNGWQFSHWTIYGTDTGHGAAPANWNPTDNPYNVNHGYSATFSYQAVFVPIGTTEPTPTPTPGATMGGLSTEMWIIIALVVVIVVILIGFGVYLAKRK
jgi:hypothetical protein